MTSLQSHSQDICNAYNEVDDGKSALHEVCDNVDSHHKKWYDNVVTLGDTVNSPPSITRRCARQMSRCNILGDTHEEYYRKAITTPFWMNSFHTWILVSLTVKALSIVPSVLMQTTESHSQNSNSQLVEELTKFYEDDIPSSSSLTQELHLWKCKWQRYSGELPNTPSKALLHASASMFPNIHCLLSSVHYQSQVVNVSVVLAFFDASKRIYVLQWGRKG